MVASADCHWRPNFSGDGREFTKSRTKRGVMLISNHHTIGLALLVVMLKAYQLQRLSNPLNIPWKIKLYDKLSWNSFINFRFDAFCFLSTSAFFLDAHMRGDRAIFCHNGSERVGRVWSAREKSLEILCYGRKLNPGYMEDKQWDTFILLLSYHDPGHGEDRQWHTFILLLSYHDPGHGEDRQWHTFIVPLSYHDWVVVCQPIVWCAALCEQSR